MAKNSRTAMGMFLNIININLQKASEMGVFLSKTKLGMGKGIWNPLSMVCGCTRPYTDDDASWHKSQNFV